MITIKDLYDIVGKKMTNEASKAIIRNNMPPHIAEQMCDAIDRHEAAEHFQRLLVEGGRGTGQWHPRVNPSKDLFI